MLAIHAADDGRVRDNARRVLANSLFDEPAVAMDEATIRAAIGRDAEALDVAPVTFAAPGGPVGSAARRTDFALAVGPLLALVAAGLSLAASVRRDRQLRRLGWVLIVLGGVAVGAGVVGRVLPSAGSTLPMTVTLQAVSAASVRSLALGAVLRGWRRDVRVAANGAWELQLRNLERRRRRIGAWTRIAPRTRMQRIVRRSIGRHPPIRNRGRTGSVLCLRWIRVRRGRRSRTKLCSTTIFPPRDHVGRVTGAAGPGARSVRREGLGPDRDGSTQRGPSCGLGEEYRVGFQHHRPCRDPYPFPPSTDGPWGCDEYGEADTATIVSATARRSQPYQPEHHAGLASSTIHDPSVSRATSRTYASGCPAPSSATTSTANMAASCRNRSVRSAHSGSQVLPAASR